MKTLKFSLLLLAALAISHVSKAQTGITIGIRGGANYNNLYGLKSITNNKGKAGFTAGAFARIGDRLYIEPGVSFSTYGAKFDFNDQHYGINFNQLEVPVLIGYKFINTDKFNVHAAVGPEGSFSLKKPLAVEGFTYKEFNPSGKLEAGVDIGNLTFDMAYSHGMRKINKGLDQSTSIYNLSIGFRFF